MNHIEKKFNVIIIGAGAAGLMCAIEAAKRNRKVLVIEKSEKIGKKILISGGGRCNFTNRIVTSSNFISANPHFAKSALSRFTSADFISLVEKHNIAYHEKKLGQLFCDGSSRQIVSLLENECSKLEVTIVVDCDTRSIKKDSSFIIETSKEDFTSESLVIASGGVSIPKMGATDFGYKVAKQFDIKLIEIRPALVPLILNQNEMKELTGLSGISADSIVSYDSTKFRENILFTHKGLSGPAILQISSYWKPGNSISLNLLPQLSAIDLLKDNRSSRIELANFLAQYLPKRFTDFLCEKYFDNKRLNQYSDNQLNSISDLLNNWKLKPAGTEGFAKAEVTLGGVDTDELSSKTMESKKVQGLYFIGEVVDVTGWLGGYNFQWAWSSGFAAGQYV